MARPNVEIIGAARLRSTMRKAGQDLRQLKDANARAAGIVAVAARRNAPRRSGALAGTVRSSGTNRAAVVRAGFRRTPYAGPNNWGWPSSSGLRGSFSGTNFITRAAKETESQWVPLYFAELNRIINQIEGI
ncbi:hypothetical protein [Arthrobacter woluwensis]|uniref:hypothetical protein n=1 Tax=Arthrobacter woluwensis TaxID=156980 RepID=UPI001AAFDEBE|nr:hypothetical protein [Arthrobacter woluwensis]QTF71764.1 HK97 gp10 family phage protein [Arthrobacter woluwensis]